jgi:hypothetical protein
MTLDHDLSVHYIAKVHALPVLKFQKQGRIGQSRNESSRSAIKVAGQETIMIVSIPDAAKSRRIPSRRNTPEASRSPL